MQTRENETRDSGIIIVLILLLGFICIIVTSGWALRFAPSWKLDTNMGSNLDPSSGFLTSRPVGLLEPIDPSILTNPVWIDGFLTPGISFPIRTALPTGTSTFTPVPLNTNTLIPTFTAVPTNTLLIVVIPPATKTPKPPPPPPSPTNTPLTLPPSADLQITKTDYATDYDATISVQYIIVASNLVGSLNDVTGATVIDTFSANLTNITWTCTTTSPGASCTAAGSGNINDTVNLPVGGLVTYTVNATVIASPTGPLVNTATVSSSVTDPNPSNNSAIDTDQLIVANSIPYGNIGTVPDCPTLPCAENISAGTYLILQFGTPLVVGTPDGYDLVYYPDLAAPTLQMDTVIIQIGNGSNWYTILNWGDGTPDTNTDIPVFPANPTDCTSEPDNCVIAPLLLTNPPGVSINLDGVVPNGTYNYIRIFSRSTPPDSGDGVDIDAITILP